LYLIENITSDTVTIVKEKLMADSPEKLSFKGHMKCYYNIKNYYWG